MKRLRKFFSLTLSEQYLFLHALFLLGVIRLGLKLLPFHTLRGLVARVSRVNTEVQSVEQAYIDKIVWAVTVASPYLRAVCLPQALATQVLLARYGYPTQLRIGFTRSKGGQMSAHAWVENQGQVVIGGAGNMARYIPVPIPEVEIDESGSWHLFT
jgi:hypothetical protein